MVRHCVWLTTISEALDGNFVIILPSTVTVAEFARISRNILMFQWNGGVFCISFTFITKFLFNFSHILNYSKRYLRSEFCWVHYLNIGLFSTYSTVNDRKRQNANNSCFVISDFAISFLNNLDKLRVPSPQFQARKRVDGFRIGRKHSAMMESRSWICEAPTMTVPRITVAAILEF